MTTGNFPQDPKLPSRPQLAHLVLSPWFWNLMYFHSFSNELLPSWDPCRGRFIPTLSPSLLSDPLCEILFPWDYCLAQRTVHFFNQTHDELLSKAAQPPHSFWVYPINLLVCFAESVTTQTNLFTCSSPPDINSRKEQGTVTLLRSPYAEVKWEVWT